MCSDLAYPGNNSSGESDTLGAECYRDKGVDKVRMVDIPAHVNESISISDMDRDATDIEVSVSTCTCATGVTTAILYTVTST